MSRGSGRGSLLVGIVILIVGVVLLLDNLAVVDVSLREALFGIVVLAVGLAVLGARLRAGRFDRLFLPAVLVLYGTLSALEEVAWPAAMDVFVPLLLVLVGVAVISRPWRRARTRRRSEG